MDFDEIYLYLIEDNKSNKDTDKLIYRIIRDIKVHDIVYIIDTTQDYYKQKRIGIFIGEDGPHATYKAVGTEFEGPDE